MKTIILTSLAMLAFAGNSVLCRLALGNNQLGATEFTIIRLLSGILTLQIILLLKNKQKNKSSSGRWTSAFYLFVYAASFSIAYITLDTGTGALILFGSVQLTMLLYSNFKERKLLRWEWIGALTAFSGFLYLVFPELNSPTLTGFLLMSISGIAWGIYTIKGRNSPNPLADTASNFTRTIPLIILLFPVLLFQSNITTEGIILAILSGSAASGIGYVIWYSALRVLSTTQASVIQLSVPIIAAIGGLIFVGEALQLRLVISSIIVLGGIALTIFANNAAEKITL